MWIKVKDRLPEAGEEVLGYWYDEGDIHQTILVTYHKNGDVVDHKLNFKIESPELRVLDSIFNPANEVKVKEDGFYFFEEEEWQKHSDIITHWMPIIYPTQEDE